MSDDAQDLDRLWDYSDPARSEARFRECLAALSQPANEGERIEVMSQVARAQGLQGRFAEGYATLDGAEALIASQRGRPRVRCSLERGRLLNSSGDAAGSKAHFLQALEEAQRVGEDALAVDAMHMLAIVGTPDEAIEWSQRALEHASSSDDPKAKRWRGSLLNNLAWTYHDLGNCERALELFEEALQVRNEQGDSEPVRIARWSVARALRSLGRHEEALSIQESLLEQLTKANKTDRYVHEELAECLDALGRTAEAQAHRPAAENSGPED